MPEAQRCSRFEQSGILRSCSESAYQGLDCITARARDLLDPGEVQVEPRVPVIGPNCLLCEYDGFGEAAADQREPQRVCGLTLRIEAVAFESLLEVRQTFLSSAGLNPGESLAPASLRIRGALFPAAREGLSYSGGPGRSAQMLKRSSSGIFVLGRHREPPREAHRPIGGGTCASRRAPGEGSGGDLAHELHHARLSQLQLDAAFVHFENRAHQVQAEPDAPVLARE